jgi:hypothetical protein
MAIATEHRKQKLEEKIQQAQGYAEKIMAVAAAVGFIACFLPALSLELFGVSASAKVIEDWRGKLDFVGYIAVGVMALQMMKHSAVPAPRKKVMACLIVSALVALLAIWLPLSIPSMEGASKGFGLWVNILAGLALLAGSALKAKQAKLF